MLHTDSNFIWHTAVVLLGALLMATTLAAPVAAQTGDVAKVEAAVEALRVAMVAGNEKELNALTDAHLTYGHSKGLVQNQAEFIKPLLGPNAPGKFNWIKISNQKVDVVGKVAWVRHIFDCENQLPDGKTAKAHIMVLQVWKKDGGKWKLFARQAVIPG